MKINDAYQKLIIQLNILEKDYFLKEMLEQVDQVKELAVQGMLVMEEIEALMKMWQSEVILNAQKEAEMLFTDEQLSALAALKKQMDVTEAKMAALREELETLDNERRQLEKELIGLPEEDIGSQLLAGATEQYWQALIDQRKNNVEGRYKDLISFIEDLKTRIKMDEERAAQGGSEDLMMAAATVSQQPAFAA